MRHTSNFATLTLCALCALAPARADDAGNMVVVRDPATGQLRAPTTAELQALQAQRPATAALATPTGAVLTSPPVVTTAPNGAMRVTIGKDALIYAVTQRDSNGKLQMQCVSGKRSATDALSQAQAPATTHVEEHDHDQQ